MDTPEEPDTVSAEAGTAGAGAGAGKTVLCALAAVAGALLAVGAVVDLWLQTISFGGGGGAPHVGVAQVAPRLLLVVAGAGAPLVLARALLGRVGRTHVLVAAAAACGSALLLLGLAV
ncbi:hypothetical protein [Kineococcus gypseus]|uniref:hypothetical protein n=1 Tax=Kineococcus gypseus TaxID=1637102 RepID=UPI003D7F10B4